MLFDDFDRQMRIYEESLDQFILPDMYMVARLDGRSFTRLTKEICKFEAPFDEKFRDLMIITTKAAMQCGFRIVYGFTESDEISLLFHPEDNSFGRKVRKLNTTLAGEASAAFSLIDHSRCTFPSLLYFFIVSIISEDGVPGYPATTLTPAANAPSAIAPFPITYSRFKITPLLNVI